MAKILDSLQNISLINIIPWDSVVPAVVVLVVGMLAVRIVARITVRTLVKGLKLPSRELIRKILVYIGSTVVLIMVLNTAGVSVGTLLGAAGVVGIAIGIASQTGISNIISGLFLLSERFFELGDVITVGERTGVVFSVDLLSIRLKTFDNTLIRIANQELISRDMVNITKFPIRRMDINVVVSQDIPVKDVIAALKKVPTLIPDALEIPEPFTLFRGFDERGATYGIGVWFQRENYIVVRNGIGDSVQTVLGDLGASIIATRIAITTGQSAGT